MKNLFIRNVVSGVSKAAIAASICAILTCTASAVQRPAERHLQGTVEAVDTSRHLIKVKVQGPDSKEEVRWVGYQMHTRVMNSKGQRVAIDELKSGELLRVTYRSHWSAQPQAKTIVTE